MRIHAISDLHLSLARNKPMHVFGEHWRFHALRIAAAWRGAVAGDDVVVVAGDISWALKVADVEDDLGWLEGLPGRKVIVKGNHDYWFPSTRRKRDGLLGERVVALQRSAEVIERVGFVGCKGVSFDPADIIDFQAWQRDVDSQVGNLTASIVDLERRCPNPLPIIAVVHYPPTAPGDDRSPFTELFESAGVALCVYGHLHGADAFSGALQGRVRGVEYRLTSADYLGFRPLDVTDLLPPLSP